MDESRFDHLAKQLVKRTDRRRVLQGVSGALAAVLGTTLSLEMVAAKGSKHRKRRSVRKEAAGRCRTVGQACKTSEDCCPGPNRNGNVVCSATGRKQKACQACPSATPTACNGGCVNPGSDSNNCGGCGTICQGGQLCIAGECRCPQGQRLCTGSCADLLLNNNNCGTCGRACFSPNVCLHGACCVVDPAQPDVCLGHTCNPAGYACDAQTCCVNGGTGSCTAEGICP